MTIAIRRAAASALVPLRARVLRPGLPESTALFPGDDETETIHLAAFEEREGIEGAPAVVGCVTLLVRPHPHDPSKRRARQLRGMAVDPALQGTGVGSKLLSAVVAALAAELRPHGDAPPVVLWCNARESAAKFYRDNGWVPEGERFDVPPIGPHFVMRWRGVAPPDAPSG